MLITQNHSNIISFSVNATKETEPESIDGDTLRTNNSDTVKSSKEIPKGRITSNTTNTPKKGKELENNSLIKRDLQSESNLIGAFLNFQVS